MKANARKHGGSKRRVRRKIHIGIDEETLEVLAVEITGSHIGDAPVLPDLLNQIPPAIPSHDRCAIPLLALLRFDALATPVAYAAMAGDW